MWEAIWTCGAGDDQEGSYTSQRATKRKVTGPLTGSLTLGGRKEHLPRCRLYLPTYLVKGKEPFPSSFGQWSTANCLPANLNCCPSSDMVVACEQPTSICSGPASPSRCVTTMDARSQGPIGLVQPRCAPCSVQPPACLLERALFAAIVTTQSSSPTGTFPMLRILPPQRSTTGSGCSHRHKHGEQAAAGNST